MSIVSSEIKYVFPQTNGVRHIHEEHTDSNGVVYVNKYNAQVGEDIDANLTANILKMDDDLKRAEVGVVVNKIREGVLLASIIFVEQTNAAGRSRVVKTMLRGDVNDVIVISKILDDFTDVQIQTLLGVNVATYNRIKTMMLKARAIESDLADVVNDPDREVL